MSLRLAFARTDCTPHDTLCTYGAKQLRFQGFSLSAHFREIAQAPVIMESVWNPFGMPARKSVLSSCSVYFRKAFSELFRLLLDFREKYFSRIFNQFRHFLKNIFSNLRTFSEFSVFSACSLSHMEYFTAFLKKQKSKSKNPTRSLRVRSNFILFLVRLAAKRSIREQFAYLDRTCDPVWTRDHDLAAGRNRNVRVDTHSLTR